VTQPRPGPAAHAVNDRTADRCRFHVQAAAPSHAAANTAAMSPGSSSASTAGVAELAAQPATLSCPARYSTTGHGTSNGSGKNVPR